MRTFSLRFFVGVILAFSLSGALAADTIKVAFVGSLSGPFALQGEETMKNIAAAADLVNSRGGVLGGTAIELCPSTTKETLKRR